MVSNSYHARYLAGEYEPVRRELIDLGPAIYDDAVFPDALGVCREIVGRARANLGMLHSRLTALGYEFAFPDAALVDAPANAGADVRKFEVEFGELPLIARVWYETISSVNFAQAAGQRVYRGREHPSPVASDVSGLGSHPVLIFQSLSSGQEMWSRLRAEADALEMEEPGAGSDAPIEFDRFLPLGGYASSCEPKGFRVPTRAVDAAIYDDGGGDMYFVAELRRAFDWGGFPFWSRSLEYPDFYSPMEFRPNMAAVLSVLREGLLVL
jgi:hypothetical protein